MPEARQVILDTDIGSDVDDAMALCQLLGSSDVDLLGVTTVYGDTMLRARLARRIIGAARRDIPVFAGRSATMSGREVWWAGHEGALYEGLERERIEPAGAVEFLVEQVVSHPREIDVLAIGPLTNIAAAIEADERFAGAVRHLWIMGGSFGDDEAEHNLRSDSAAARIVFSAGIPTTITGLDVTRKVEIRRDQLDRIAAAGQLGTLVVSEIEQWWRYWGTEWNVPHDPVTVLTLVAPELFTYSDPGLVTVELGGPDDGRSTFTSGGGATRVVGGLEADAVAESIVTSIIKASSGSAVV